MNISNSCLIQNNVDPNISDHSATKTKNLEKTNGNESFQLNDSGKKLYLKVYVLKWYSTSNKRLWWIKSNFV